MKRTAQGQEKICLKTEVKVRLKKYKRLFSSNTKEDDFSSFDVQEKHEYSDELLFLLFLFKQLCDTVQTKHLQYVF